jgi:uncharacterized protein YcnI
MKRILFILFLLIVTHGLIPQALAHVVVKPSEVGVAAWQTFTVGVPNEKDNPTVGVRLLIPEGLQWVTPNVKPGWKVEVKKEEKNGQQLVKEIIWTGGAIPVGQRDDFFFSAKAPEKVGEIVWKAYQTYQDGSVVSWDKESKGHHDVFDFAKEGPYSKTTVVDDLGGASERVEKKTSDASANTQVLVSYGAFVMAFVALIISLKRRNG